MRTRALSGALCALLTLIALPVHAQQPAEADAPPRALPDSPVTVKVELRATPRDARIYQGDKLIGTGEATVMVAPGSHSFRFEREGYTTLTQDVALRGDETLPALIVQVHMSRVEQEREASGRTGGLVEGMGDARLAVGWASLGVGAGLIALSVYLGMESGVAEGCSSAAPTLCDEVTSSSPAIVSGAFGGALLVGGLGLLVWDALAGKAEEPSAARIRPVVGPDSAGVVFGWSF